MKVEIRRADSKNPFNRYYYVMVSASNEDMNTSEMYFSKWNAKRAANNLAKSIPGMVVVDTTAKPYNKHGGF